MRDPTLNLYPDPVDGCALNRVIDSVFAGIARLFRRPRITLLVPEPMARPKFTTGRTKIIEINTQAELRRMITAAAYDVAHASERESRMSHPMPVGRGPMHDAVARLYDLRRRLELRIEQDAGLAEIEERATDMAAEIILVASPLRAGQTDAGTQRAIFFCLAEIATRVQARSDDNWKF